MAIFSSFSLSLLIFINFHPKLKQFEKDGKNNSKGGPLEFLRNFSKKFIQLNDELASIKSWAIKNPVILYQKERIWGDPKEIHAFL